MPLLRGRIAKDARASLADLSARTLRLRPSDLPDASLGGGLAGIALVHAVLDDAFPRAGHGRRAEQALDCVLNRLQHEPFPAGLYSGLAGVGWVVTHLVEGAAEGDDDPCAAVDAALLRYLGRHPWRDPFDLIEGLVGIGVYGLERLPRPAGKRLLDAIVGHLKDTARRRAPGVAWWSDPEWVPPKWRQAPHPDFNLGVAHGTPGVIALLGRIAEADVDARTKESARTLLAKAVEWLLAQELPRSSEGCFAAAIAKGIPREPARLAWCFGDPGIAATLLVAARASHKPAWERAAISIGLRAAARSEATSGVRDAGLCHGAAGVAHIFHRLYRTTGEKRFAEASRVWFARALTMRATRGFAGFRAWAPDAKGKPGWRNDPGFLMGAAGIALALVAATTDAEPAWDRVLLLSS